MVLGKEARPYPGELAAIAKRALNKLNECRRKLGDTVTSEGSLSKKNLAIDQIMTPDDILMRDQLNFIYNVTNDLEKTTNTIIG